MSATSFKALKFERNEPLTKEMLDQVDQNHQWLYENTPRGRFMTSTGHVGQVRTILVAGRVRVPPNRRAKAATLGVRFGPQFHPNCKPYITTGIVSDATRRVYCVVNGPGTQPQPNANGFQILVRMGGGPKITIRRTMWIHWHAFGWYSGIA